MEAPKIEKPKPAKATRSWGIARGERVVISAGLAVAAIVLGVLVACAWWTLDTLRAGVERSRRAQAATVSELLAAASESMLVGEEWTSLRRMVADAAVAYHLKSCRITLGDGSVLADADPGLISSGLPEQWPPMGEEIADAEGELGLVLLRTPILVKGRGQAMLEISADTAYPFWADWEVQAGLGAIGAGAMCGLFLVYRTMRRRWRALGAVGDALRWEAAGKATPGSLNVAETFGPEAAAWNAIVSERDRLREVAASGSNASPCRPGIAAGDGQLGAALDALWQGLMILDEHGKVTYANGAAGVLLKAKRDEVVDAPAGKFIKEEAFALALDDLLNGKGGVRTGVEFERKSETGERTVLRATIRRLRRDDGAAAVIVLEDVTQQRVADESRNAFVAQATHELRTPLTSIRLYVETLLDESEKDEAVRAKCLNVINSESRRLERIVGDMLSVAEIEAGSLKLRSGDVRLPAMFEELEADFKAQATDKEISLVFELPPKLPVMQGDRDKILLALHNLVGNAIKYTPAGGKVVVKIDTDTSALSVGVVDDGIGIKEEEHELVFDRFYRAKDRRISGITGSGIGLSLARQVARLHGGDISVRSQIDKGSTFTLVLPLGVQQQDRKAA